MNEIRDTKNRSVGFATDQMQADYEAAKAELLKIGYNIYINQGRRTPEQDVEAKAERGFGTGGDSHIRGIALDIGINNIKAFVGKTHTPTPEGLASARQIAPIMEKYGFNWKGESDIVHFEYTKAGYGSARTIPVKDDKKENVSATESFFNQCDRMAFNLTNINSLPDKKIKEMANFLIKAGKQKVG